VRAFAVLFAVLLASAVTACGSGESEGVATTSPEAASPSASERPAAPAIEGETLDGDRLSLDSFRGKPVLVNVWSSW
jgi:cytochrome oxidase Cu insertion factor (SCO1/SenC/PrrC family)